MPEVSFQTVLKLPMSTIWDFVKDMDNWAPFVTGYQSHEIHSDSHSVWTLKGDVGVLAKTVNLDVHITEWSGPNRVAFTLEGIDEQVGGGGHFEMETVTKSGVAADEDAAKEAPVQRVGLFRRFLNWFFRRTFKKKFGVTERKQLTSEDITDQASRLRFTLRMDAKGPTAPLVNAMLGPALEPAAEELANKIAAHLEG